MLITELPSGTIRATVEKALDLCPEAQEPFEQGRMRDVLGTLEKKLEEYSESPGVYEEGSPAHGLSMAYRLMSLIGLDKNPAPPWDAEGEGGTEAA